MNTKGKLSLLGGWTLLVTLALAVSITSARPERGIAVAADPPPEVNITKVSTLLGVPGTCFELYSWDNGGTFQVCDDNIQPLDSHVVCEGDGTPECEDADPAPGMIRVAVALGDTYNVTETKPPVNHDPDPLLQRCFSVTPESKCDLTFVNAPRTTPWFPWDVNGDNAVSARDFFLMLSHFNEEKP
jgi:hypothetical protein